MNAEFAESVAAPGNRSRLTNCGSNGEPPPGAEPLLAFDGVTFCYPGTAPGAPPALLDVTLTVRPGDRVGVVGPNGGGKTTLVKLALGMFRPTTGRVTLCGDPARWSRHVPELGYIGNPSRNDGESGLPLDLTVARLLDTHRALFRRAGTDYAGDDLAARLHLDRPEWRRKRVSELSDGWRQRVLAYLALVKRPRLLIADEATAGLDPDHRPAVLGAVRDALASTDMAVVWVTHAYSELLALGMKTVVRVERGRPEPVRVTGWRCRIAVDGGEAKQLLLTADSLFELFGEHVLAPEARSIRVSLDRPPSGEEGAT